MSDDTEIKIEVRATVILRVPNLDIVELKQLYLKLNEIKAQFGGEFDVTTTPQPTSTI